MSFDRLRRISRTVGFRLALWSAACFALSTGVAFGLAYVREPASPSSSGCSAPEEASSSS